MSRVPPAGASLNRYGDRFAPTSPGFGADIAGQRLDALDEESLEYARSVGRERREGPGCAVDLGCGSGVQGMRFAAAGLETLLIDVLPLEQTELAAACPPGARYFRKDVREIRAEELPELICLLYSQRFIHYLKYGEAREVLRTFRARMPPGARLFLSASGLESELGEGYAGKGRPPESRFTFLSPAMQAKHGITHPVCLYSESELALLCVEGGFRTDRIYSSEFGNVKLCCTVP